MKRFYFFAIVFLFMGGLFSVNAQDMLILRDGNVIEAKVMEIHPSEIRYRRFDNLNGPMIIIPASRVLSIRYENGVVDIINASPAAGQTDGTGSYDDSQLGTPTALQIILNAMPAIPIAGNNLKFQFGGDTWLATVNGQNFSKGTIESEAIEDGYLLTLKQTHIWPGAVGQTAGRVASRIPGGNAVGGALDTAGRVAGAVGAIEASGLEIVLEYKSGPPAKLSFVRSTTSTDTLNQLTAENKFNLDNLNVFAISINVMPTIISGYGYGITMTVYEKYKPGAFFTPSFFLTGKLLGSSSYDGYGSQSFFAFGAGVLFKHRFPKNRVIWNFGASLELMWASGYEDDKRFDYTYQEYYDGPTSTATGYVSYNSDSDSFLLGMGIQTGFSFRLSRYISLDINGLIKFGFGKANMEQYNLYTGGYSNYIISDLPPSRKSFLPFAGGIEFGLTFWMPYRSGGQR